MIASISSFLVTGPSLHAQTGDSTALVVEVSGLTSHIGAVQIGVFDSEEQWLDSSLREEIVQLYPESEVQVTFLLPPGEYGVAVIHDKNSNGELDANLLGKPTEPFGFSNNISHMFSPPSWDEAMVSLSSEPMTLEIRLETR